MSFGALDRALRFEGEVYGRVEGGCSWRGRSLLDHGIASLATRRVLDHEMVLSFL